LDIPRVEYSDGFRSGILFIFAILITIYWGMRAWNRTVQFWLANFVYRRTRRVIRLKTIKILKSKTPKNSKFPLF
jgi:hypothetical protein